MIGDTIQIRSINKRGIVIFDTGHANFITITDSVSSSLYFRITEDFERASVRRSLVVVKKINKKCFFEESHPSLTNTCRCLLLEYSLFYKKT